MSVQAIATLEAIKATKFQYILCVGSRRHCMMILSIKLGFNTSYVSVQVIQSTLVSPPYCFNTSYVSVQVILSSRLSSSVVGFNTSYVSVQEC